MSKNILILSGSSRKKGDSDLFIQEAYEMGIGVK